MPVENHIAVQECLSIRMLKKETTILIKRGNEVKIKERSYSSLALLPQQSLELSMYKKPLYK